MANRTPEEFMKETDHLFPVTGAVNPECQYLREEYLRIIAELENPKLTKQQENALIIQERAIVRSLQTLRCGTPVIS